MSLIDFYVKDKQNGIVHRVGSNKHDSIWVDSDGTLHYHNLQNGDGCSSNSRNDDEQGYEFVASDCGEIETAYQTGGCLPCCHCWKIKEQEGE